MMWWWVLIGCGGATLLFLAFVVYVIIGMRRALAKGYAQVDVALANLAIADIGKCTDDCIATLRDKLDVELSLDTWQTAIQKLDTLLTDHEQKRAVLRAFERDGISYYGFIALGACLGTLIERHSDAVWKKEGDSTPYIEVPLGEDSLTLWPFDKVRKQFFEGESGDLVAYVHMALHPQDMLDKIDQSNQPEA